jgi:hypothetical protein
MIEKKILLKDSEQVFQLFIFTDDILDNEYALIYKEKREQHFIDIFASLKTFWFKKQINWLIGV